MASNGNVSHASIWDDSALVDSWNDALEEYKRYHSIQARGENVDEVLKAAEDASTLGSTKNLDEQLQSDIQDQQAKKKVPEVLADHGKAQSHVQVTTMQSPPVQITSSPPALPQHLVGQVHDEGLKNLLMSWYYSGYYTGLYEGQKKE